MMNSIIKCRIIILFFGEGTNKVRLLKRFSITSTFFMMILLISLPTVQVYATHITDNSQASIDGYIQKYGSSWPPSNTIVSTSATGIQIGIMKTLSGPTSPIPGLPSPMLFSILQIEPKISYFYRLYRGYLSFDTSDIPDNANIASVKLKLRCKDLNTVSNFNVKFYKVDYGSSLDSGDWNAYQSGTYLTSWSTANYPGDDKWITLTLSTSVVNKQGKTQFCLRHENDDIKPPSTGPRYVYFWSGDASSDYRPELEIKFGNKYAVLIAGGWNASNNYARYWNDLMFMYDTLKNDYSFTDNEIYVLYADENSPNANNCPNPGDAGWSQYNDKIDYSASSSNLQTVFNTLSNAMGSSDFLFIFTTDHGYSESGQSYLDLWEESIRDDVFAGSNYLGKITSYFREVIVMEQCNSGGFINDLSNNKRVVITACTADESSYGCNSPSEVHYDEFVYHWISAANLQYPNGTSAAEADYNDDGLVSMYEAWTYANNYDTWRAWGYETPQLNDPGDIDENTFL